MIYLAGPYTHPDQFVVQQRGHQQAIFAIHCATKGHIVYSPVAAWHRWSSGYGLPMTPEFWQRMSLGMLRVACELWVLCLDGWESSKGLQDEIRCAKNNGIKIRYFYAENYREAV